MEDSQPPILRFMRRTPKELHAKLVDSAGRTLKSLNAETVARLNQSFEQQVPNDSEAVGLLRTMPEQLQQRELEHVNVFKAIGSGLRRLAGAGLDAEGQRLAQDAAVAMRKHLLPFDPARAARNPVGES